MKHPWGADRLEAGGERLWPKQEESGSTRSREDARSARSTEDTRSVRSGEEARSCPKQGETCTITPYEIVYVGKTTAYATNIVGDWSLVTGPVPRRLQDRA